jgi:hypothetical protein
MDKWIAARGSGHQVEQLDGKPVGGASKLQGDKPLNEYHRRDRTKEMRT